MSHRRLLRSRLALGLILSVCAVAAAWAAPEGLDDLAGPLKQLALQSASGAVNTAGASKLGLKFQGSSVQVTVLYRSAAAAAATGLARYGARTVHRRDRRVEAMLPVNKLLEVAALPQVAQVQPAQYLIPMQGFGLVSSQGVQLTRATAMHLQGVRGKNVRVAVIDLGFGGLLPAEVPVTAASGSIISYRADASTVASTHGTAVAEILADMAPECSMTLIAVDTALSAESALQYCMDHDIQIINISLGIMDGPFDGTHPLCKTVDAARAAGALVVVSAGNFAQRHWQGPWQDTNDNGLLEFSSGDEDIAFLLSAGTFDAYLSWYSQGTLTSRDYDLVLLDDLGNEVARSAITQNGDDAPSEQLRAYVAAGTYRLRVERMSSPGSGETADEFHLFTPMYDLEAALQHSENSLSIPADAAGALAVGATRGSGLTSGTLPVLPIDRIEPYSSRGAVGSSAKPDLVGPDMVNVSATTLLNPFTGTSAAAPHVAGAAALLMAEDPSRSAAAVCTLLQQMARKYTIPGDIPETDMNAYGYGRVALRYGQTVDGDAPTVNIDFPVNNTTITVASPRVVASLRDTGGVDRNTLQVTFDGNTIIQDGQPIWGSITDFNLDTETGTLSFVMNRLTRTHHTLTVQVADLRGNVSAVATSNFRITTQTLRAGLHIISLPYPDLAASSPADVFGVPLEAGLALLRWVPSDSRTSKYHIYPDEFASFHPPDQLVNQPPAGLGYFLKLPSDGILETSASGLTDESYNISLVYGTTAPRGWNLIGNPYESYVDWGSVEFISDNGRQDLREAIDPDNHPVTEGVLFGWVSTSGGGYYSFSTDPTQFTLEPLQGYWLHVLKNATLVVHNTGNTVVASKPRATTQSAAPTRSNWLLKLEARAGKYEDPINYIGVSSAASDGYDAGADVSEPPPLVDSLRLYMPTSAGSLAKDMRNASGPREWKVDVACRLKDVPVTVSWPTINATVPKNLSLRLQDLSSGATVYMRTTTGYTFTMSDPGVRHLRITVTDSEGSALTVTGVSSAAVGGSQVAFTYTVTREAAVNIEIRNMSGVLIRSLGQKTAAAGTSQTALWNGQNSAGSRVPAGKYLARITARAADGQTVQVIQPFHVGR